MPEYGETVTEDGEEWFIWRSLLKFKLPYDPNNPVFFLAAPPGGPAHANFPFAVKGDDGLPPTLQEAAEVTEIEWDDATPVSSSWELVTPASGSTPAVYKEVKTVRKGEPGADGTSVLNPASFGTPAYRKILQVNSAATGFEYATQRVGGMHWPVSVTEAGAGTTTSATIATISVPANTYPFPWRPDFSGMSIVSSTTTDMQVDLVARLTNSSGAVLGKCTGLPNAVDRLVLASGPDTNASDTVNKIAANAAATFVLRAEKIAGTGTFATGVIAPTRFCMTVVALL